ncbi:MAG: ferritin-like domain-containing protein [Candidatus Symbiodolus clandestinus]
MLEKIVVEQLSSLLNHKGYSSYLYLQMSAWCADQGFSGSHALLRRCAQKKQQQFLAIFDYINDTGALPVIGTLHAPPYEFSALPDLFQQIYEQEQAISERIACLVCQVLNTQDYFTFNFLQTLVTEQRQEEKRFKTLLDQCEYLGENRQAIFCLDHALKHSES